MKEVFIKTMLGWKTIVQFEDGAIARPEDHPLEVVVNKKVYLQSVFIPWPQDYFAGNAGGDIKRNPIHNSEQ